jgi:hypothetical protein
VSTFQAPLHVWFLQLGQDDAVTGPLVPVTGLRTMIVALTTKQTIRAATEYTCMFHYEILVESRTQRFPRLCRDPVTSFVPHWTRTVGDGRDVDCHKGETVSQGLRFRHGTGNWPDPLTTDVGQYTCWNEFWVERKIFAAVFYKNTYNTETESLGLWTLSVVRNSKYLVL